MRFSLNNNSVAYVPVLEFHVFFIKEYQHINATLSSIKCFKDLLRDCAPCEQSQRRIVLTFKECQITNFAALLPILSYLYRFLIPLRMYPYIPTNKGMFYRYAAHVFILEIYFAFKLF